MARDCIQGEKGTGGVWVGGKDHFRPQRPHSFWSTPRIVTSGKVQFFEHAQSIGTTTKNEIGRVEFGHFKNGCSQSSRFPVPMDKGNEGSGNEIGGRAGTVSCAHKISRS